MVDTQLCKLRGFVFCLQVCECLGLEWEQTIPQQFDNVAVALLTFFEISTTEAWTAVTYAAIDATEEDMQPIRDKNLIRVWFFILFMLFGAYLVMNLFVGVVVDNFKKVGFLPAHSLALRRRRRRRRHARTTFEAKSAT